MFKQKFVQFCRIHKIPVLIKKISKKKTFPYLPTLIFLAPLQESRVFFLGLTVLDLVWFAVSYFTEHGCTWMSHHIHVHCYMDVIYLIDIAFLIQYAQTLQHAVCRWASNLLQKSRIMNAPIVAAIATKTSRIHSIVL